MILSSNLLFVPGVTRTVFKVLQGEDPSLTDAFLLAAGVVLPLSGITESTLGQSLSALNNQGLRNSGAEQNSILPRAALDVTSMPIPSQPQLNWGPLAEPVNAENSAFSSSALNGVGAQVHPIELPLDSSLLSIFFEKIVPSLREQVANGEEVVVLDTEITDVQHCIVDGKSIIRIIAHQQVADASDLHMENILDLISRINRGESFCVSDVFFAVVKDLFEHPAQTFKNIFSPMQVYSALRGTRTVSVDITSSSVTREDETPLGTYTKQQNITRQKPGVEMQSSLELTHSTDQHVSSLLEIHNVEYRWSKTEFKNYTPTASEAATASGKSENSHIIERTDTTTTETCKTTAGANIPDDSKYEVASSEDKHIIDSTVKQYYFDKNVSSITADARLTEEELAESQAQLQHEGYSRTIHVGDRSVTPPKVSSIGADTVHVDAAKPEILNTLNSLMEQMKSGQSISLETASASTGQILEARQNAGGMVYNQNDKMSSSYEGEGIETKSTSSAEHTEDEGTFTATKVKTTKTVTNQEKNSSQISADQIAVETKYAAQGIYANGLQLPFDRAESSAFITVHEANGYRQGTVTNNDISKTFLGSDTGKSLGKDMNTSATDYSDKMTPKTTTYHVMDHDITDITNAIADGRFMSDEISALGAEIVQKSTGPEVVENFVDVSTESRNFQSGWLDYVPLGSVASLGVKSSFGYELNASDVFWAAADAALTVGTLGAGTILAKGAMGVGRAALKGQVKQAGKIFVEQGSKVLTTAGKNFAKDVTTPFVVADDSIRYVIKHGPVEATKEIGRQAVGYGKQVYNVATGKNHFDLDKIHGISKNGPPINSKFAGQKIPASEFNDAALRQRYPNGVDFTKNGYPDFKPYANTSHDIKMTGNNATDFARANMAAGFKETPKGFTWHHNQNGRTMELIPTEIHQAVKHTGGASLARAQTATIDQGIRNASTMTNVGTKIYKEND